VPLFCAQFPLGPGQKGAGSRGIDALSTPFASSLGEAPPTADSAPTGRRDFWIFVSIHFEKARALNTPIHPAIPRMGIAGRGFCRLIQHYA